VNSDSNNSGSNKGTVIALAIGAVTVLLVVIGTVWPSQSALANGGSYVPFLSSFSSSPEGAVNGLLGKIGRHDFASAYDELANKSQFTEPDFERDLNGTYASLRTYAALTGFDVYPQHSSADEAKSTRQLALVIGCRRIQRRARFGRDQVGRSMARGLAGCA
jgi:hypothetical protein